MMCAYNRVNDTSSCHNGNLIGPNGFLRKNGFQGRLLPFPFLETFSCVDARLDIFRICDERLGRYARFCCG